jgi:hypothetical protein
MAPRWHPGVVALTQYDGPNRPVIDLEMESPIPSEVRHSFHNQPTRRRTPLRNDADGNCAHKSKNQKNVFDETVSWFHGTYYAYDRFFASTDAKDFRAADCVRLGIRHTDREERDYRDMSDTQKPQYRLGPCVSLIFHREQGLRILREPDNRQ